MILKSNTLPSLDLMSQRKSFRFRFVIVRELRTLLSLELK